MTDKITLDRAVVELALAWLEALTSDTGRFESEVPPIAALRAALAEQPAEQEPVADALIRKYIAALVANSPDEAANATKAMVDYVYTTPQPAKREPHEPIWRDAIDEIEALRAEVERLSRYYKNGIDCFANPCERHSGERTPPFAEFFEKYGGQCLICVVDNNKALQAEIERLALRDQEEGRE